MKLGEHEQLECNVAEEMKHIGVRGAYFVMEFEPEKADAQKIASLLAQTTQKIRADILDAKQDQILAGFRDLHTAVGVSNRKHVSSPENLINLVLAGRDVPTINPIVDVYNMVSLQTRLALGAHDTGSLVGPIGLRFTDGTESFMPLGSVGTKAIAAGEYAYIDEGRNEIICRLETRQCEKTKVSASSRSCFFIVQGNQNTSSDYIKSAVSELQALLVEYCGGYHTQTV